MTSTHRVPENARPNHVNILPFKTMQPEQNMNQVGRCLKRATNDEKTSQKEIKLTSFNLGAISDGTLVLAGPI